MLSNSNRKLRRSLRKERSRLTLDAIDGLPIDAGLLDQANSGPSLCPRSLRMITYYRQRVVWSLFTAAYATDPDIRSGIIDEIWGRIYTNATDTGAFSTDYSLDGGGALKNFARLVQCLERKSWSLTLVGLTVHLLEAFLRLYYSSKPSLHLANIWSNLML